MMIVTKFPTFLLRSSHSGRKFIEGRAPLASFDGWRSRSTAGPTSLLPGVLSFLSEAREVSGSETPHVHHAARRRGCVAARDARTAAGDAGIRFLYFGWADTNIVAPTKR
jgi:hypothetical protein